MDRLASCYFCGVAVDAPLEEYPVVPRDLRPSVENQQTVVLCPECRRKLSTVVDSVVTAATDPDQTTLAETESDTVSSESADAEHAERTMEAGESTEDRHADDSLIEGFGHDDEPSLIDVERPSEDEPTVADDVDAAGESAGSEEKSRDTENAETPKTDATDAAGDANVDGDDTKSDPASNETADREFSKTAYNRIVRLLQNREFPLEAEEITTIADSAYEIEPRETDAVIDALVDRGVIDREGEQLFRPDGSDD